MDFSTFSLSFFVIRLVLGLAMTGILIAAFRPATKGSYVAFVVLCSLPALLAIGVAPRNQSACFMAGISQALLFLGGGLLFGTFKRVNNCAPANVPTEPTEAPTNATK